MHTRSEREGSLWVKMSRAAHFVGMAVLPQQADGPGRRSPKKPWAGSIRTWPTGSARVMATLLGQNLYEAHPARDIASPVDAVRIDWIDLDPSPVAFCFGQREF